MWMLWRRLREAREKGISVITLDADAQADSRSIYIKPVDAEKLGRALVRSAVSYAGAAASGASFLRAAVPPTRMSGCTG